ncbi:MAG: peptidoglycan DD-metalloendopeptidase family protein [Lachnospiraceae bacterium]|nr:peptidoglycan DD-metalloendopeptidase family protein [Lachnospiraceae bacterium]
MKEQKRSIIGTGLVLGLCLVVGITATANTTIEDMQRENEILEAERRSSEAQRQELDSELETILADMIQIRDDLRDTEDAIYETEIELVQAKVAENDQMRSMERRIQFMFENGNMQFLELIFSSETLGDFINKVEYVQRLSDYDRQMLVQFQEALQTVADKEEALKVEYESLKDLQDQLIENQERIETLLVEKDIEISDLENQIGVNATLIAELIAQAEAERIRQEEAAAAAAAAEEAARAAEEARQEEEARRNQEAQDNANNQGNINDQNNANNQNTPENPGNQGGAPENPGNQGGGGGTVSVGQFAHPAPGTVITSGFGWRAFDNAFHNGVDFAGPTGLPTFAAEAGTVVISGFSVSAGNWVVINHGNGLVTKYMHHSSNLVVAGQQVARGQQVGTIGNTGFSFGAHLHFQVEINGVPVNPMQFL